jgi:hypothetical protein
LAIKSPQTFSKVFVKSREDKNDLGRQLTDLLKL